MADSQTSWTLAEDLTAKSFNGVALSLFELYRTRLRLGQGVIGGLTFTDCRIEGPAVLLALGGVVFDGVDFGYAGGDIRNLILRPASPDKVVGVIPVKDCSFVGTQFFGVGFTGSDEFLKQLLAVKVN